LLGLNDLVVAKRNITVRDYKNLCCHKYIKNHSTTSELKKNAMESTTLDTMLQLSPSPSSSPLPTMKKSTWSHRLKFINFLTVRNTLMLLFLIHACITVSSSWILLYTAGQSAVATAQKVSVIDHHSHHHHSHHQHIQAERTQIFNNVELSVTQFMQVGPMVINLVLTNLEQNRFGLTDPFDLAKFLFGVRSAFGVSPGLYYGNERDEYISASSNPPIQIQVASIPGHVRLGYSADSKGNVIALIQNSTWLPVTSRPWYEKCKQVQTIVWSDVFVTLSSFNNSRSVAIAITAPVFDTENSEFQGVFGMTFSLSTISKHLDSILYNIPRAHAWILDRNGTLIAASQKFVSAVGNNTLASQTPVGTISRYLAKKQLLFSEQINYMGQVSFNGGSYKFQVSNYTTNTVDLDWLIVVAVRNRSFSSYIFRRSTVAVVILSFLSIFIGTLVILGVTQAITIPLFRVRDDLLTLSSFATLELHKHKMKNPFCEIRAIHDSTIVLARTLQSFKKYVPEIVMTNILLEKNSSTLGMTEKDISILFTDIVDFTNLAESTKQDPSKLLLVVGEYFEEISNVIDSNFGVVDKYIGDAVMALWLDNPQHSIYACHAAYDFHQREQELRLSWRERGLPELKTRIGINSGRALVGNIGSSTRLSFTAVGDSVNIASRLEGLNKLYGTDILIGEVTYENVKNIFLCEFVSFVTLKGKQQPMKVYRLVCPKKDATSEMLIRQDHLQQAHDAFFRYSFLESIKCYEKVLEMLPPQQPPADTTNTLDVPQAQLSYTFVNIMIEQCNHFIEKHVTTADTIYHCLVEK
jgi:adenylate cyclase